MVLRAQGLFTSLPNVAPLSRRPSIARRLDRTERLGVGDFGVTWHDAIGGEDA
jgi:hypothetical protein